MNTLNVVESIFFAALEKESAQARAAYLNEACRGDAQLRSCVEKLLNAHPRAEQFLQAPPPGPAATVEPPALEERPGTVIGPYKLLQQLGEGGFGVVFLAEQSEPVRRKVALKIIKPGMDSRQVVARFEAERQALALMDHPNIARVFDGGTTESGRPYFVMELVKGVPITKFCDQNRLTPRERLELFVPVCQAVQHAHQKGVIHRDLKPSNVLVTLYDDRPVPKVIDFGVAKAVEQRLTEQTLFTAVGQVVGTLEYMSPEQASLNALDVDTRSDVYALGVLLYELLTGSTPLGKEQLQGVAFLEMLRLIRETEPPRPSTRLSQLGGGLALMATYRKTESQKLPKLMRGELDWIAMKALDKDRGRRYETASALAADVRRYLSEEPVEARAPSAAYRLRKFVKRHRGPVLAAAVVLLALLTGAIGTTWGMVEAVAARDEEARQRQAAVGLLDRAVKAEADARTKEQEAREEEQKARKATDETLRLAKKEAAARKLAQDNETKAEWRLYASHIASAQREWETHNVALLYDHLNLCRPDFRGWEHDYLYTLANKNQQTLRGHTGAVYCVAFSPDGKYLASSSGGLINFTLGHEGDKKRDNTVKLWDAASGQEIFTLMGHTSDVMSVAFSPDSKRLLTASADAVIQWDAASGKELRRFKEETRSLGLAPKMAFSPDGKRLASVGGYGLASNTVRLRDVASGREVQSLTGHTSLVKRVAFSPDGRRLATASMEAVKVWELVSGKDVLTLKGRADERVTSVAFSPDGKCLASGSSDQTVKVWDAGTGKEIRTLRGHTDVVLSVAFSPDGKRLASGSTSGPTKVWDLASGKEVFTFKGHAGTVMSLAFSPDGKRLASGSSDKTVKLWDTVNPNVPILTIRERILDFRSVAIERGNLAFSPDSKRLAGALADYTAKVWDTATGQELRTLKERVRTVAFSPDGKLLAAISAGEGALGGGKGSGMMKLWDMATGKEIRSVRGSAVRRVAFSPDGKRLAIASSDGPVEMWDAATGKEVRILKGHTRFVISLAFSPDGKRLASASADKEVKMWNADTGQEIFTLQALPGLSKGKGRVFDGGRVFDLAFSPDGKRLAGMSREERGKAPTVVLWDAISGQVALALKGHTASVNSVAFSPDGKRLATASDDSTVKLWDAASGQEILTLKGHTSNFTQVAFSPDGKLLAAASQDRIPFSSSAIRIWDASKSMKKARPK